MHFREAIRRASDNRKPLAAFNIFDMSSLRGVVKASASTARSVIVQVSARTVRFYGARVLRAMVNQIQQLTENACFLHLDHCEDQSLFLEVIEASFDGFMIDLSAASFEQNCKVTAEWVNRGHSAGLVVEAE